MSEQPAWVLPALKIQMAYWSHNPVEKEALLRRGVERLGWGDLLRLHHLTCMELYFQAEAAGDDSDPQEASGPAADLCRQIIGRLLGADSPYRPRAAQVWQKSGDDPDLQGTLANASVTHLGSLEIIRMDQERGRFEGIEFVPFADLHNVELAEPGLFRPARVNRVGGGGPEVALIPLLYGVSWLSARESDYDGSMTRFCAHLLVEGVEGDLPVGIGHQDFMLDRGTLFGMASVAAVAF